MDALVIASTVSDEAIQRAQRKEKSELLRYRSQ
jgi:hypothetical protein